MKTLLILVLAISALTSCGLAPESTGGDESTATPLVSDFTAPGTFPEAIEGPAVDKAGNVYAVNFRALGTIGKVGTDGNVSLFVTLPEGSIGNGIRIGKTGDLFVADSKGSNVLRINSNTQETTVFAHSDALSLLNDLAITDNGTLYASDPNWADSTGRIWKVTTAGFKLAAENLGTTNGIEVSPDGTKLYFTESYQNKVWSYDIQADGNIDNKQLIHQFTTFGIDGMRCHSDGRLFVSRLGNGTVAILSPEGVLLSEIVLKGKEPNNVAFSPTFDKCYVTVLDRGCIEVIDLSAKSGISKEEQELLELLPVVL